MVIGSDAKVSIPYNNIEKIFEEKSNIKVIGARNAHHGNILDQEDLLIFEIIFWNGHLKSNITTTKCSSNIKEQDIFQLVG